MHEYKFHIIYKTTNLLNGKIYVGLHSTDNLNDRYMGSGWVLKYAIKVFVAEEAGRLAIVKI